MKAVFAFLFAFVAVAAASRIPRDDKYTTKYDNIDLDAILKNDRLLGNYVNCLLDKGNCTPEGSELRKVIPDALANKCAKCNETQKKGAEKVIKFLIENKKDLFKQLEEKYDPSGTYRKKYEEEASKRNIQL